MFIRIKDVCSKCIDVAHRAKIVIYDRFSYLVFTKCYQVDVKVYRT